MECTPDSTGKNTDSLLPGPSPECSCATILYRGIDHLFEYDIDLFSFLLIFRIDFRVFPEDPALMSQLITRIFHEIFGLNVRVISGGHIISTCQFFATYLSCFGNIYLFGIYGRKLERSA